MTGIRALVIMCDRCRNLTARCEVLGEDDTVVGRYCKWCAVAVYDELVVLLRITGRAA